ncbi:MAG: cell division protein ZapA [Altererythrobacter sp.]|nr:cell division protein ZapA [Altererythrobacter sp.]
MSEITLTVGGQGYTVACPDGEEAHIRRLAAIIDGKLATMGGAFPAGDPRNLLFAALIMADEVEEARGAATSPGEISEAGMPRAGGTGVPGSRFELTLARHLEALADRMESLASTLESAARNA